MEIRRSRYRSNRRVVVFALFVLAAFGSAAVVILVAAPTAQNADLALQSPKVMLSHEAPKAGAPTVAASSAPEGMATTGHTHQP